MRHSDPRLTANIYTDTSKLPTYAAVSSLSWISSKEKAETEKDTAGKSNLPPQLAPQKPDFRGQNEAQAVSNTKNSITPQTARIGAGRAVIDKPCRAFSTGGEGGIRRQTCSLMKWLTIRKLHQLLKLKKYQLTHRLLTSLAPSWQR